VQLLSHTNTRTSTK